MFRKSPLYVLSFALVASFFTAACSASSDGGTTGDENDVKSLAKCGGITGLACSGGKTCVDDPTDSCDPQKGGRDCIGVCINAAATKKCGGFAGLTCSSTSTCVDDPTDSCDPSAGGADCSGFCVKGGGPATPPPSPRTTCGGIAGLACPSGATCVDDPNDACDPAKGGRDCSGVCVEDTKICGGFAGIQCPSGSTCVDNPTDNCDPNAGGRDCSGLCVSK